MSDRDRLAVGPALAQLREVISILRELGNAGPRDQSFKQWRQVAVTLLQRIWPGEPARAAQFRRIAFSAPSLRADAAATRECFERGCAEATAYLEGLALELENVAKPAGPTLVRPVEVPLRQAGTGPRAPERSLEASLPPVGAPVAPPPAAGLPPAPAAAPAASPAASLPPAPAAAPAPSAAPSPVAPPAAASAAGASGPPPAASSSRRPGAAGTSRHRLKDMLGFGDDAGAPPAAAGGGPSAPATPAMPPVTPAAPTTPVAPPAPRLAPITPLPTRASRAPEPAPAAEVEFDLDGDDFEPGLGPGFDPEDGAPMPEDLLPPPTVREFAADEPAPAPRVPSRAAREVLTMAAMVDQLGVPPQRRAIVRAALIDLGRQMESPPVHWAAIRQAMAFMMDYPQIARRVIPMLMPYLDEAA